MPVIFDEGDDIAITPTGVTGPRVTPESVRSVGQQLYQEARAGLEQDFPGVDFAYPGGGRRRRSGAAEMPEPIPSAPAEDFTIGGIMPREEQPEVPAEAEVGWWDALKFGSTIAKTGFKKLDPSSLIWAADQDPVELARLTAGIVGQGAALPPEIEDRIRAADDPEQRKAAVEKAKVSITAMQEELAGKRPKTDEFWKNAAMDATGSVLFQLPALAAGFVGGPQTSLMLMGMATYYSSYGSHRAAGASPDRANVLSAVDMITEVGTEMFPTAALFKKTGLFRKALEVTAGEVPGELMANWVQTSTAGLAELPPDATSEQILASLKESARQAYEESPSVAGATVLAAGAQAGAVRGTQALIDRATRPTTPQVGPVPPTQPPPAGPAATPPPAQPGPTAAPAPPPAATPAGLEVGQPAVFKPNPATPGTAVQIVAVDTAAGTVTAVRLDEKTGEPMTDADGEPMLFQAAVTDFPDAALPPAAPTSAPSVPPAQPQGGPPPPQAAPAAAVSGAQAPPAATTTEPTSDLVGQVREMYRQGATRRGVYVSPATVEELKAKGQYAALTKVGVVAENFDGQGGVLITKTKKDLDEAKAARDGGQTDMQAIIGGLTGAGVAKPKVAKPVVVQRKDDTGAVVQQTAVAPEVVQQTVQEVAQQPGTVEVTTPEAALAEREQKVQAERAVAARAPVYEQATQAVEFAQRALDTPKEGGLGKTDVREGAMAVSAAAMALRAAANDAMARGATAEQVTPAMKAAGAAERLGEKSDKDFRKGRGVSERILRERLAEIRTQLEALAEFSTRPKAAAQAKPAAPKAAKAKAVSKAKAKPAAVAVEPAGKVTLFRGVPTGADPRAPQSGGVLFFADREQDAREYAQETDEIYSETVELTPENAKAYATRAEFLQDNGVNPTGPGAFDSSALREAARNYFARPDAKPWIQFSYPELDGQREFILNPAVEAKQRKAAETAEVAPSKLIKLRDKAEVVRERPIEQHPDDKVVVNAFDGQHFLSPLADVVAMVRADLESGALRATTMGALNGRYGFWPHDIAKIQKALESAPVAETVPVEAPKVEKVTRKKTKYIPPKKRVETPVEQAVAEVDRTVVDIPTVEMGPMQVPDSDLPSIVSEILDAPGSYIAEDLQRDRTGQLAGIIRLLQKAVGDRGGWMGWFASTMRGDILGAQKTALRGLLRQYSAAEDSEIPTIREQILGLLTNVDGKTLPMPAISAVFEAANVGRAYKEIREALEGDIDVQEMLADTTTQRFDTRSIATNQPEDGASDGRMTVVSEGEMGTKAVKSGETRELNAVDQLLKTNLLANAFNELSRALNDDGRLIRGVLASFNARRQASVAIPMRTVLAEMSRLAKQGNEQLRDLGAMIDLIATRMPDIPLEIVNPDAPVLDVTGKAVDNPAMGYFMPDGVIVLSPPRGANGATVALGAKQLQVLLHEAVHAATWYHLSANPNGRTAAELTAIRKRLIIHAMRKFGRKNFQDAMRWYQTGREKKEPAPDLVMRHGKEIYALLNNFELTAEVMTSPAFHEFVRSLDVGRESRGVYSRFIRSIANAIAKAFGFGGRTKQEALLRDLIGLTIKTMEYQQNAMTFNVMTIDTIARTLQKTLNVPEAEAREAARQVMAYTPPPAMPIADEVRTRAESMAYAERLSFEKRGIAALGTTVYANTAAENAARILALRATGGSLNESFLASPDARFPNHQQVAGAATPALARATAALTRLSRSGAVGAARDAWQGFKTTDFLVRRASRFFGGGVNPLTQWKVVRDTKRSYANQLQELAESTVNAKWMKLTATESEQLGTVLQESSLWQIDPSKDATQPKLLRGTSKKAWEATVAKLNAQWAAMSPLQRDIYVSTQKYFQQEYSRIRRAAVDMAVDMQQVQLTPLQKTLLYAVRSDSAVDKLVGGGKQIDLGDGNDKFAALLKDLIRVSTIKGPYFPLFRQGEWVVEAEPEGLLSDPDGTVLEYADKAEAQEAALEVRMQAPGNMAKVLENPNGTFSVKYKAREVSFHQTENEAAEALEEMKRRGFAPKNGVYTRKLSQVTAANTSEGMKELVNYAQKLAGNDTEGQLIAQTVQSAFLRLLAERAASASQQLNRKNVAGFKGKEAHETFAKRVRASSWHYATLKTALQEGRALTRLRAASRATDIPTPTGMTVQEAVAARGRTLNEVVNRLRVEADALDEMNEASKTEMVMGSIGFVNFLATPSYAMVNAMQNFNVALPVMLGKYGTKGVKAMARGMQVVAGPGFAQAMRGLFTRPGDVSSYDVYNAIREALVDHPRYGRFVQGTPDNPSALQQLVDRGVINASFVQELAQLANNQNLYVARGLEYLRLMPQGVELWNRISTSLAVLEVTNGNVDAAADMVTQVHFDYAIENRPRFFRRIGGTRLPQWLTMFKLYGTAMYQLNASLLVDALSRRGQSMADRGRAATALAGIIASHTLSAGLVGGAMVEPLRLLVAVFNAAFGDDDEFKDLDTMVQRWAMEYTGNEDAARVISKGVWNALGFDLSTRMGLDRVMMYNPPEGLDQESLWKALGQQVGGPIPAMIIQKSSRAYELWSAGKPFDALTELIPVRMIQDVKKAWKLYAEGVTTKAGATIVSPEQFNWLDYVGTAAGFRTTEAAKATDLASTEFQYKGWRRARASQLIQAYTRAHREGDEAGKAEALAAIEEFNRKNPKDPITGRAIGASYRSQESAARERRGEGRNRALRELLAY